MKLTKDVVDKANSYRISIEELVYLYTLMFELDWELSIFPASIVKLTRLGLLKEEKLTPMGEEVVAACVEAEPVTEVKSDMFEEIWSAFPRSDEYRHFPRTRAIRCRKQEARRKYEEALKEYSHEELLEMLEREVKYYKQHSTTSNLFKYMKGPVNWFASVTENEFKDEEVPDSETGYGKEIV